YRSDHLPRRLIARQPRKRDMAQEAAALHVPRGAEPPASWIGDGLADAVKCGPTGDGRSSGTRFGILRSRSRACLTYSGGGKGTKSGMISSNRFLSITTALPLSPEISKNVEISQLVTFAFGRRGGERYRMGGDITVVGGDAHGVTLCVPLKAFM